MMALVEAGPCLDGIRLDSPRRDRTLLGAPGIATRNKKLLVAPGRTTRSNVRY